MRISCLLSAVLLLGCAGAPEPSTPPPAATPPAAAAPAAPGAQAATPGQASPAAPAGLDLSTPEKARRTIYEVLKRGDKEAFRQCVSRRMLEKRKDNFDAWYAVWKSAADKGPQSFEKIAVTQEDGVFKLDEN
ncbi:MAG: hypothetical protein QM820_19720 [Minicystis sp.]